MQEKETLEEILKRIADPAVRIVAEQALETSKDALNRTERNQKSYVADEVEKIIFKALKVRMNNETK